MKDLRIWGRELGEILPAPQTSPGNRVTGNGIGVLGAPRPQHGGATGVPPGAWGGAERGWTLPAAWGRLCGHAPGLHFRILFLFFLKIYIFGTATKPGARLMVQEIRTPLLLQPTPPFFSFFSLYHHLFSSHRRPLPRDVGKPVSGWDWGDWPHWGEIIWGAGGRGGGRREGGRTTRTQLPPPQPHSPAEQDQEPGTPKPPAIPAARGPCPTTPKGPKRPQKALPCPQHQGG